MHKMTALINVFIKLNIQDQHIGESQKTPCPLKHTLSDWLSHTVGFPGEMCAIQGTGHYVGACHRQDTMRPK